MGGGLRAVYSLFVICLLENREKRILLNWIELDLERGNLIFL